MALPPTVPTSFVPKQPVATTRRARTGTNLFLLAALIIMFASFIAAAGVFAYDTYLGQLRDKKAKELVTAEESINRDTVEDFIRLRNRIDSTDTLLGQHVAVSQFLDLLESISAKNVTFNKFSLHIDEDRTASLKMGGTAVNFNALAAESAAFAAEKRIRRAIFSGISTDAKGAVIFSLAAELDPRLVVWTGPSAAAPEAILPALPQVATTTPAPVPTL